MSDWEFLNRHRVSSGPYASTPEDGWNGAFGFAVSGEARRVFCICSDGLGWKHVSVSFGPNKAIPSWQLMCKIKDLFFEPCECVVQYHPPNDQHISFHDGCLHLWMPTEQLFPAPPGIMVGPVERKSQLRCPRCLWDAEPVASVPALTEAKEAGSKLEFNCNHCKGRFWI